MRNRTEREGVARLCTRIPFFFACDASLTCHYKRHETERRRVPGSGRENEKDTVRLNCPGSDQHPSLGGVRSCRRTNGAQTFDRA